MSTYRKEALTRIIYLSVAFIVSVAVASGAAFLAVDLFAKSKGRVHDRVFSYSFIAVFALICGMLVYMADKNLNRKFNKNP